jgi:hypothetical protein
MQEKEENKSKGEEQERRRGKEGKYLDEGVE